MLAVVHRKEGIRSSAGKYPREKIAFVVELVSCCGAPPSTGNAQALKTPDWFELTRIFFPSCANDAPKYAVFL
jgi:hypothetical protein